MPHSAFKCRQFREFESTIYMHTLFCWILSSSELLTLVCFRNDCSKIILIYNAFTCSKWNRGISLDIKKYLKEFNRRIISKWITRTIVWQCYPGTNGRSWCQELVERVYRQIILKWITCTIACTFCQMYFDSPQWNNYRYICSVQFMVLHYKSWYRWHLERSVIITQGLYMDFKKMLWIQQIYVCPSVKSHHYYCASYFVMQNPKVKKLALYFPFKKYLRSMYRQTTSLCKW